MAETATQDQQGEQGGQALRNRLYTEAQALLRERHEDEFTEIVTSKYAEHGLTYRRRLDATGRAEEQVRKLLAEHPDLGRRLGIAQPEAEQQA